MNNMSMNKNMTARQKINSIMFGRVGLAVWFIVSLLSAAIIGGMAGSVVAWFKAFWF